MPAPPLRRKPGRRGPERGEKPGRRHRRPRQRRVRRSGGSSAQGRGNPRRKGTLAGVSRGNICGESRQASAARKNARLRAKLREVIRGNPRASTVRWRGRSRCVSRATRDGSGREGALGLVVFPWGKGEGPRDTVWKGGWRRRVSAAGRSHSDRVRRGQGRLRRLMGLLVFRQGADDPPFVV